jgi:hypothetical protein
MKSTRAGVAPPHRLERGTYRGGAAMAARHRCKRGPRLRFDRSLQRTQVAAYRGGHRVH